MTRMTAKDFFELLELYDFTPMARFPSVSFWRKPGNSVGGLTAAALGLMSPNYALAEQVGFNDPDIVLITSATIPQR